MTVFKLCEPAAGESPDVAVWRCEGCGCIHLRAGEVLLTFTAREYADFTERVADCYWEQALRDLPAMHETGNASVLRGEFLPLERH